MTGIALPGMGDAGRPAGLPRSDESGFSGCGICSRGKSANAMKSELIIKANLGNNTSAIAFVRKASSHYELSYV